MIKTLFVGGVRSGKSALSQRYAESLGKKCVYVATASSALAVEDTELQARILAHQKQRQGHGQWRTCECPSLDFSAIAFNDADVVLIDCLTLWLGHILYKEQNNAFSAEQRQIVLEKALDKLVADIQNCPLPLIMVSSEVGQGIVPMQAQSRAFCDALGLVNQRVASVCEQVILVSCGLPLALKGTLLL